ncbi:MAG: acetyl-CoA C-acetyltransferase [bacterium]
MRRVVLAGAVRTAIGDFNGALASVSATRLGAIVMTESLRRAGIPKERVDEVIMGNVLPHGLGQNPARQAAIQAGMPWEVGCITVNKVCGSGLKAVMLAAQAIQTGDADVVIAGGMENMNRCPYLLDRARSGYRMGHGKLVDGMLQDGLWDINNDFHMGVSAELCAQKYGVSREEMDRFALGSYEKVLQSIRAGHFRDEIVPVEVPQAKGPPGVFEKDEVARETTLEALSRLRPAFKKDGMVTAGNSSKISDGAAAVVCLAEEVADRLGVRPMARVGAQGSSGLDPKYVLVAPILSIPKVLKKAGLRASDIDLHEVNEAFASSTVAVLRELALDPARVNIHGGAIALGHPIGASGARVLVTLLHAMKREGARRGMASLCLGGGEAVSLIVESC